jgi:hypothetical protein
VTSVFPRSDHDSSLRHRFGENGARKWGQLNLPALTWEQAFDKSGFQDVSDITGPQSSDRSL